MTNSTCTIDGCHKNVRARGWCATHYSQWQRRGHPTPQRKIAATGAPLEFANLAVTSSTDQCILWPYGTTTGYGCIRLDGRSHPVHRWVLNQIHPAPDDGMDAAHAPEVCHNRLCINPRHLRWATRAENLQDKVLDGTDNRGERCGSARLTEPQVLDIRHDARSVEELADAYDVAPSTIRDVLTRRTWAHVTG